MFKQQTTEKIYNAALYCRLSKDDGQGESSSISTQKEMLTQFAKNSGYKIFDTYVDDGFSGLNFERPSFKRMIDDIKDGKINMVITKDLSRLGRNYLDCGAYIEIFFPENGVRYLAINDSVDTLESQTCMDITAFRNLLNEMYSKDISKKIKSARKTRLMQGSFMGVSAPYGYLKSPTEKGLLIIDERYAPIVRRIFDYAKQGLGIAKIRKILTDEKVPRPGTTALEKCGNYERFFDGLDEQRNVWSNNSVRNILRSPVYAGHLVGYRRPIPSMKSKKRLVAPPDEWLVVRDTHEPIISDNDFELVQRLITSRLSGKKGSSGYNNIFSGIIKCADCGYAMNAMSANRRKRPDIIDCVVYACNNYRTYGKAACSQHSIEARTVHNVVLADIQKHAKLALKSDDKLLQRILKKLDLNSKSELNSLDREVRKATARLSELDRLFAQLYEDRVKGDISDHNYQAISKRYEDEQSEIEIKLAKSKEILATSEQEAEDAVSFVSKIKDYSEISELTAPILNALIERITVSEPETVKGERIQIIKIYYKFIGCIA